MPSLLSRIYTKLRRMSVMRRCRKNLGALGKNCLFDPDIEIKNPANISIGDNVRICSGSRLLTWNEYAGHTYSPKITVGSGTRIGKRNSFSAISGIEIGRDVLFADMVHVTDHSHGYDDIDTPIIDQPLITKGKVVIGDQCWLGFCCEILSGVKIGRHTVVAAHAVVTRDLPDYCIAAGNPARIVKRYDKSAQKWVKAND